VAAVLGELGSALSVQRDADCTLAGLTAIVSRVGAVAVVRGVRARLDAEDEE
jgi:hypothetical protein